jgi:hypothetical protein
VRQYSKSSWIPERRRFDVLRTHNGSMRAVPGDFGANVPTGPIQVRCYVATSGHALEQQA